MEELRTKWIEVCEEYRSKFNKLLQDSHFEWANAEPGVGISINDIIVDMSAVRYTIDNNISAEKFIEWFNYCLDITNYSGKGVDIASYCDGYRPYSDEQMEKIRLAFEEVVSAKENFDKILKEETKK